MPAPQPPKNKREMNWGRFSKTFAFWILILLIPVALIQLSGQRSDAAQEINYNPQYYGELARDNIKSVTIREGKYVQGEFRSPITLKGRSVTRFTVKFPAKDSEKEIAA